MANNKGKEFEEQFKKYAPPNCSFIYRLRDAGYTGGQTDRRFTITNSCDFIAYSHESNTLLLLELKHFKGNSKSFTGINEKHTKEMVEYAKKDGVKSYIVFEAEKESRTWAVPASKVYNMILASKEGGKKSINITDMMSMGIEIPTFLMKTKFKYRWSHIF